MKKSNLLFLSGLICFVCLPIGAWKKIIHHPESDTFLGFGWIAFAIFYVLTLREILSQPYPNRVTKIWWLFLVLGLPPIGALIYHVTKKKTA